MPRRWGQHFLRARDIARRIVAWAGLATDRPVFEIGPGSGALTAVLLEAGYTVVAVEVDPRWVEYLQRRWPAEPRLRVVAGDVLRVDWHNLGLTEPFGLIGNIPYEISSPLLERLMRYEGAWYRAVWTVQREFGERLEARPATADYGALSVIAQLRWSIELGFTIPPGAFRPPPKVESVVIRIDPRSDVPDAVRTPMFSAFVHAAFRHRRKTLLNSLLQAPLWADRVDAVARCLKALGLATNVRAEQVSLETWPTLWSCILELECFGHLNSGY
ncbi:MAG: 16S rRNA (adenine(1518)-N(6)/adenine(1519)-N(6))-dimethyltransferase RsmA [Acidobacteria bacterium]|nr:16S rRNA (adenine(1518)-N(6)/adenine(1519)-N(6))-dimethyltransferase RsmA [Acidobacteriota bacterium]MDW7984262.1 16S rRNA (adenine(1518)-N(6)/adenine(1519)-N(6))-dimethyltransferase RsmA [Acidobacteriota bacterium]